MEARGAMHLHYEAQRTTAPLLETFGFRGLIKLSFFAVLFEGHEELGGMRLCQGPRMRITEQSALISRLRILQILASFGGTKWSRPCVCAAAHPRKAAVMNVRQAGAVDRAHRFRNAGFDNER